MSKIKTSYICENCSYQTTKWMGKCPACDAWNSMQESTIRIKSEGINKNKIINRPHQSLQKIPTNLSQINLEMNRIKLDFPDINDLLGGGFKEAGITLLSGEPGIGKSTLTLQICQQIAQQNKSVIYMSGEESSDQIISRAFRLNVTNENIQIINQTNIEDIIQIIDQNKPDFVIVDSIQVVSSNQIPSVSGSINQIRFCAENLMEFAKTNNTTILIIGHVTKDGNLAGPRVLEHLVDTVLFLEGERSQNYRILRSFKNRYGSTNEISILEMKAEGLVEVNNPSEIFLEGRQENSIGSAITVNLEGNKAFLLEAQALTNPTVFGYPKRTAIGFDLNRTQLLAAVIQKYLKINLNSQDIYINIIGGFKLKETANDLAIAAALISSYKKIALSSKTVFLGEVGLSGEIRNIHNFEKRVKEAEKMGFENVITANKLQSKSKITISRIKNLQELISLL